MDTVFLAPVKERGKTEAEALEEELGRVLLTSDIRKVDSITERLRQLADTACGITVPAKAWSEWIARIRREQPDFRTNCLLAGDSVAILASAAEAYGETRLGQMMDAEAIIMLPQTGEETERES